MASPCHGRGLLGPAGHGRLGVAGGGKSGQELGRGCSCWKQDPLGADEDKINGRGVGSPEKESEDGSERVSNSPEVTQQNNEAVQGSIL